MMKVNDLHTCIKIILVAVALLLFGCQSEERAVPDGFQIHPDFNLELVASEPLIFDPVDMKFDERGKTFVLEMPGYPKSDRESRLIELLDTNDDCIYDQRKIVADSLGVATAFMPYNDGFLISSPPHLLWIGDTDNDGKIDERKKILGGFSTGNLQHNFNGLTYGLDNWIYAANGGNSGKPFFENRPNEIVDLRENDLKINLENKTLARVGRSSGGFKITFDQWGHLFSTHNMEHVSQLVFEDRYIENLPGQPRHALTNISDHEANGTSRIYPIGEQATRVNHPEQSGYFSGACGITYYGGGAFPETFENTVLVPDCVLNLVHLDVLSNDGSSMKASRTSENTEFLASADRSFRPVNLSIGPDGALYVIDMSREVIEHPEWIPDELEVNMDLDAGRDKGRIYRITPKANSTSPPPNLNTNDPEILVKALGNKNQWVRTTAQRILVTHKIKDAVPFLISQIETSENPLARLHSLWTLNGLGEMKTSIVAEALNDRSDGVLENAIKIAETRLNVDPELADKLLKLTEHANARVRMQATLTLTTLEGENYQRKANSIAEAMSSMLKSKKNDTWAIKAVASALQKQALPFSLKNIANEEINKDGSALKVLSILTEFVAKNGTPTETATLLKVLDNTNAKVETKVAFVESLGRGWQGRSSDSGGLKNSMKHLLSGLESLEEDNQIALLRATGRLRRAMELPASTKIAVLMKKASRSVLDNNLSVEQRMEQLQLIALDDFKNRSELLYLLLDNKQPLAIQKEAISQLADSNNPQIAKRLLAMWPILGPQARKEATDILLYKTENHKLLLTAMETDQVNLGEFNLDLERRRVLLLSGDEEIRRRSKALFSDAGVVKRKDAIAQMRPSLTIKGDALAGAEVFSAQCAQCHRYDDLGQEVGPVLTEVNRKSKESLLHDILDPNAAVDTKYLNYQVSTKDGRIFIGLVFLETDTEIGLKMIGGKEKTIPKTEILKFASLGTSMMFEGLEANIDQKEMADLLAFLQKS